MGSKEETQAKHVAEASLEHSQFSPNFGCHIIIVSFHEWRNVRPREQRRISQHHKLVGFFCCCWGQSPHPCVPGATYCTCIYLTTCSLGKNKSKLSLRKWHSSCCQLVTWIPGVSSHDPCLPQPHPAVPEFSGPQPCAEVLLGGTCSSRFCFFSSPLGQPRFHENRTGRRRRRKRSICKIFIIIYLEQTWIGFFGRKTSSEDWQGSRR